ncbi:MAG: sensor histidine kinase, partial [Novosphingobium sp.]
TVNRVSEQYLVDIAAREAANIDATLSGIEGLARILSLETKEALATPWTPDAAEKSRYHIGPDGVFHTIRGGPDDTASFYSGYVPVGRAQIEKAWQTGQLDHTMRHIKTAWTDAYVDPAGSGWMVSAVAPVYSSRKLEAVVGIDLTIDTIVKRILSLDLPWQGYAMLIGRDGTILALPPAGEKDLDLSELKNHDYAEAIFSDTFKPDRFNIARRPELRELARAVRAGRAKVSHITLAGRDMLATTASVTGPGWSLVVVAPAARILADANYLHDQLVAVGIIMLLILLVFYAVFFSFLLWRARVISRRVAEPLLAIEQLIDRIGAGQYSQVAPQFGVREIDNLSARLADMGERLGDAHDVIVEQQAEMARTLESERRVTSGQRRFIQILSHEFRTPLTVIDSCGQILRRRADRLTAQGVVERSDMIRGAAGRIREVMQSALQLVQMEDGKTTCHPAPTSPGGLLRDAVAATQGTRPVAIEIAPDAETAAVYVDRLLVHSALAAIVENACRYSPED